VNINKLDKIVLRNKKEVDDLLLWRDNNKELVRRYNPVMNTGLIESFNGISITFDQKGMLVRYEVYNSNRIIMRLLVLRLSNGKYRILHDWYADTIPLTARQQNVQSTCTIHFSLMAYMEHYREYITETKQRTSIVKHGKKSGNKKSVRKIGKRIYTVSVPKEAITEKRKYTKSDKPFPVCGHWRHYKSGKVSWIPSYVKGDKTKEREPVIYKM
jgi:hypothetical protein